VPVSFIVKRGKAMTQRFYCLLLALLLTPALCIFAREDDGNPLDQQTYIRKPQQLVTFTMSEWDYRTYYQQVHTHLNFPGRGDSLVAGPLFARADTIELSGHRRFDMITGNVTGNNLDEVVAAWETGNRSVALAVSSVNQATHELHDLSLHVTDSLTLVEVPIDTVWMTSYYNYRLIRLEAGQFDDDEEEEFVLAYWAADSTVRIELYDGATGFTVPHAVISDQLLSTKMPVLMDPQHGHEQPFFDIALGDFDADGLSEIILVGKAPDIIQSNDLFAAVYDYIYPTSTFTTTCRVNVPHQISGTGDDGNFRYLSVIAGRMNKNNSCDGVISLSLGGYSNGDPYGHAQIAFDVSEDLTNMMFGQPQDFGPLYATYGADVNSDGILEAIFTKGGNTSGHGTLQILTVDSVLAIKSIIATGSVPSLYYLSPGRRALVLADVEKDTLAHRWLPELIVSEEYFDIKRTYIYDVVLDSVNNLTALHMRKWHPATSAEGLPMALAAGNFDGGAVRLGTPGHWSKTDMLQPIVILNAPPVHFDAFDGVEYDVSKSYPPNTCQFYSRYEKQSQSSVEVQTKVSRCWATSQSFGLNASYYGLGVSTSFEQRYGRNFSKVDGSSKTVTIAVQVDAREDDAIYATVVDYDIWEYPVFVEDTLLGHVLVLDPLQLSNRWFPSKSWSASAYIPNHEVGNILSYQRYPNLVNNSDVASLISGTYDQSYTLHSSSSYNWDLRFQDFVASQTETSREIGFNVNAGGDLFGFTFGGTESYSEEDVSTHTTSVTQDLVLSTHLDAVDLGLGEVRYTVTPYSYWARNGALVVDYAVQPDLAPPGFTPTWWQRHYDSIPDPSFILPWRLDPEKGFVLEDETKRHQTNEIIFSNNNPDPGDTIAIRARLHNFSLSPTVGPVMVKFYVGDPDSGGVLMTGIHGETELLTDGLIPSRDKKTVQMLWRVPESLPQYPKIYALLDPDHEITEIHEENNKGWTVLGKQAIVGVDDSPSHAIPSAFRLQQNYPNPFNPTTVISFDLPRVDDVRLVVYDLLGREVTTLLDEMVPAGSYRLRFDASGMASGVYYYRLTVGPYVEVKKMILIR
jgi:hypothetical protein